MMDLMNSLTEFNEVRFSAYRTAMKLRTVQKRMCRKYKLTLQPPCAYCEVSTDAQGSGLGKKRKREICPVSCVPVVASRDLTKSRLLGRGGHKTGSIPPCCPQPVQSQKVFRG